MLRRNTLLKVNIREQLPRPFIRAAHPCLPQIAQTTNHIRNSLSGDFFSSLLVRPISKFAGIRHRHGSSSLVTSMSQLVVHGAAVAWRRAPRRRVNSATPTLDAMDDLDCSGW